MNQPKLIFGRPSDQGRAMIEERLKELEGRVKAVVALVEKVKEEKALLQQRVEELQGAIKEQTDRVKALETGRKKDQQQLSRILEEREEVRLRVDHLLEEIARIEASVEPGP